MNRFQRFGLFGIVSGLVSVSLMGLTLPVQAQTPAPPAPTPAPAGGALSTEQVAERLNLVPVFTIVSQEGTPVLQNVTRNDGQSVRLVNFWIGKEQADAAIAEIQQSNPEVAAQSQVIPISLGEAYQMSESQDPEMQDIAFQVLPRSSDVQSAVQILQANGETGATEFPGVPLFYGISPQGLLTIEKDGVEIVPFFFDQQDLKTTLERAGQANPDVVSATDIQVTSLGQVVETMKDPQAQGDVQKIAFVPTRAALEFIQSMASQLNTPQVPPTP